MLRDDADGGRPTPTPPARDASVIWHDVECGAYAADLRLWEGLADEAQGPILDLGCGTGRVGLHLARRGHSVFGLDLDADLVAAFNERAGWMSAEAVTGDARDFGLGREFPLVLAPMQLVQLLGEAGERVACLRCVQRHLRPGGRAAFAIVERMPPPEGDAPPLPDVRDDDGWVYSSLPLDAAAVGDAIAVRRLRQVVSPDGSLSEEKNEVRLRAFSAQELEREGEEAGLTPAGRREIPATDAHVGSTVIVLGREA